MLINNYYSWKFLNLIKGLNDKTLTQCLLIRKIHSTIMKLSVVFELISAWPHLSIYPNIKIWSAFCSKLQTSFIPQIAGPLTLYIAHGTPKIAHLQSIDGAGEIIHEVIVEWGGGSSVMNSFVYHTRIIITWQQHKHTRGNLCVHVCAGAEGRIYGQLEPYPLPDTHLH